MGGIPVRWLTVFLDFPADSFDAGVAFWREVTGYGLSPARGAAAEFATLLPPEGDAYLRVQRLSDGAGGCHLDLHIDSGAASLGAAAGRATELGARVRHREDGLIIAESPGGFVFCLVAWEGEGAVPPPFAGATGGTTRVDTLCLDVPAGQFERECSFWAALTGWEAFPAPLPDYVFLRTPGDLPVRVILQRLGATDPGEQARGHVDFGCTDPEARGWHVARGARVTAELPWWTVLTDPAAREYCLVRRG